MVQTPARPKQRKKRVENLLEKTPSRREKNIYFLHFFCFWPPRAADKKTAAKMASEVLPERLLGTPREPKIDQLLASGRPGGRAKSFLRFRGASPGAPGRAQEGQGAFRTPPGGSRANSCQKCCTVKLSSAGPPKRLHLAWGSQFLHRPKGGSAHSCVQNPLLADVKIQNPEPNAAV